MNNCFPCRLNRTPTGWKPGSRDGTTLAIDCIAVITSSMATPRHSGSWDWLLYNKPLSMQQLVLGSDHFPFPASMADWKIKPPRRRRCPLTHGFRYKLVGIFGYIVFIPESIKPVISPVADFFYRLLEILFDEALALRHIHS